MRSTVVALVALVWPAAACGPAAPTSPPAVTRAPLMGPGAITGAGGGRLGAAVAGAGDANGDGRGDFVVGEPRFSTGLPSGAGRVLVGFGAPGGFGALAVVATGDQADAHLGASVAWLGDVDGDGLGDVAIGEPDHDGARVDAGRAWVYFGDASGSGFRAAWQAGGTVAGARFGATVAGAGDVDGDGHSDLLVGAPDEDGAGKVYLFLGTATGLEPSAVRVFEGAAGDRFGAALAGAGDLDGDGFDDVVIGAPGSAAGKGRCGVVRGAPRATLPREWGDVREGAATDDALGAAVAIPGDLDADGFADCACGAPGREGGGAVEVVFGAAAGASPRSPQTVDGAAFGGPGVQGFGAALAAAGDANGDGAADLAVGAGVGDARAVIVLAGARASPLAVVIAPPSCTTCDPDARPWTLAAPIGDVDGDGYADLALGAPMGNVPMTEAGQIDLRRGGPSLPDQALWTRALAAPEGAAGIPLAVALGPDVAGSGRGGVMIGWGDDDGRNFDPAADATGRGAQRGFVELWQLFAGGVVGGQAYLAGAAGARVGGAAAIVPLADRPPHMLIGAPGAAESNLVGSGFAEARFVWNDNLDLHIAGASAGAAMGSAVAAAGDVDGDGWVDVVLGAPGTPGAAAAVRRGHVALASAVVVGLLQDTTLAVPTPWSDDGDAPEGALGAAVAGVGDTDGDGFADFVVGAPGARRAYLYRGRAGGVQAPVALTPPIGAVRFGAIVAAAGDVDGDGRGDILVGDPGVDADTGRVYLYRGATGALADRTTLLGAAPGDRFGASLAPAGDVDDDGFADVLVGAPGSDAAFAEGGRVMVFRGSPDGLRPDPLWSVDGDRPGAQLGEAVAGGADLDGDGVGDLALAARDAAPVLDQPDAARVFVYRGNGATPAASEPRPLAMSTASSRPLYPWQHSRSPVGFSVVAFGRSPFGRGALALEVEAKPADVRFDGRDLVRSAWSPYTGAEVRLRVEVSALAPDTAYHWRARIAYAPRHAPPQASSRWLVGGAPGLPARVHLRTRANAAPIAGDDAYTTEAGKRLAVAPPAGSPGSGGLLGNDLDPDADDQPWLTAAPGDGPAHGDVTVHLDGAFEYTPDADFVGYDHFDYVVSDGNGGTDRGLVTVAVVPIGCREVDLDACRAGVVSGTLQTSDGPRAFRCAVVVRDGAPALECDRDAQRDLELDDAPRCGR